MMVGLVQHNGLWWPETDVHARAAAGNLRSLKRVYESVRDWSVAVQAGGNVGVWPIELSRAFGAVYTFEPEETNWRCLTLNCAQPNIYPFRAALGCGGSMVGMQFPDTDNCGSGYVSGPGAIPVLEIDHLGLSSCGLIALDIEGMERRALLGARSTIERHRPVVLIENKAKCAERFNETTLQSMALMSSFGYKPVASVDRDVILCPQERTPTT